MAGQLLVDLSRAIDSNANPLPGAKWKFYLTGTTTPLAVFANSALTVSLGSVVSADSAGRFPPIFLDANKIYRTILTTSADVALPNMDIDPVVLGGGGGSGVGLAVQDLTILKATPLSEKVKSLAGRLYVADTADFTGKADDLTIVKQNETALNLGAWRLQQASEIAVLDNVTNPATRLLTDRISDNGVSIKSTGSTGNNLATDGVRVQDAINSVAAGGLLVAPGGPVGGAYKITNDSFKISKLMNVALQTGATLRSDVTVGSHSALRVNPIENMAGGYFATVQGYFTGTNLVITTNIAGKIFFNFSGLSATGVLSGTHLAADVLSNATGTYAVKVNDVATAQTLGSAAAPLTISVIFNDVRGMTLSGGSIFANGSGYGLTFGDAANNACFSMIGTTITNMSLAGGLGGLYIKGGLGREHQWFTADRCTIEGAVISAGSDGIQFRDCIMSGTGTSWDLLEGAFHDGMFNGTAATKNGVADVLAGSRMKWHDVQCEQSGINAQTPYKTQFMLRNFSYANVGSEIIGCNLGGGLYNEVHAALYNTRGLVWDRNYMNVTYKETSPGVYGDGWDLFLSRDAANDASPVLPYLTTHNYNLAYKGKLDAYDTIIGYYNRYRGARVRQGVTAYTDNSRLMRILTPNAPNNKVRMPHRGLWMPLAELIDVATVAAALKSASVLNTHPTEGFQIMIEHSGAIKMRGSLTHTAAGLALYTDMFTLPEWLLPFREERATAISANVAGAGADVVCSLIINSANGVVTLMSTPSATALKLNFNSTTWMAVTDPYPTVGP